MTRREFRRRYGRGAGRIPIAVDPPRWTEGRLTIKDIALALRPDGPGPLRLAFGFVGALALLWLVIPNEGPAELKPTYAPLEISLVAEPPPEPIVAVAPPVAALPPTKAPRPDPIDSAQEPQKAPKDAIRARPSRPAFPTAATASNSPAATTTRAARTTWAPTPEAAPRPAIGVQPNAGTAPSFALPPASAPARVVATQRGRFLPPPVIRGLAISQELMPVSAPPVARILDNNSHEESADRANSRDLRPAILSKPRPNTLPKEVSLGHLPACRTPADEDVLKQRVIASVEAQVMCKSDAGTYRFLESKNLNAFSLRIQRNPDREAANRCDELQFALDCLVEQRRKEPRVS